MYLFKNQVLVSLFLIVFLVFILLISAPDHCHFLPSADFLYVSVISSRFFVSLPSCTFEEMAIHSSLSLGCLGGRRLYLFCLDWECVCACLWPWMGRSGCSVFWLGWTVSCVLALSGASGCSPQFDGITGWTLWEGRVLSAP